MPRYLLFLLALILSCQRAAPVETETLALVSDPFEIKFRTHRSFFLEVGPGWTLKTKRLEGELRLSVHFEDGILKGVGLPPGRTELYRFDRGGVVELRLEPGTYFDIELDGLYLEKPKASPTPRQEPTPLPPPSNPNILIYMVDTLRSDSLGCYGGPKAVSPNFDRFAADATLYTNVISPSSWTKPTVGSLFTGLSVRRHGATYHGESLLPENPTLAELLKERGYQTACYAANPNLDAEYGFSRGFEEFYLKNLEPSVVLQEKALIWLDARNPQRPFFLYLHSVDPHHPYTPPERFRQTFAPEVKIQKYFKPWPQDERAVPSILENVLKGRSAPKAAAEDLRQLYLAEVAYNDSTFGALIQQLKQRGLYESTLIVLVSDHGEEFQEHGSYLHGWTLYEEQLDVPMVVRYPGGEGAGSSVSAKVNHMDLFHTVVAFTGAVPACDGVDLRGAIPNRLDSSYLVATPVRTREAIYYKQWKMIRTIHRVKNVDREKLEIYDLQADPGEKEELTDKRPALKGYLAKKLSEMGEPIRGKEVQLSEERVEQLKALNYL